jgi:hypothetical protein
MRTRDLPRPPGQVSSLRPAGSSFGAARAEIGAGWVRPGRGAVVFFGVIPGVSIFWGHCSLAWNWQ